MGARGAQEWVAGFDPRPFMRTLIRGFGVHFVLYLVLIYGFLKGLVYQALIAVLLPFFKVTLGVSAVNYQKYYNVASMAFAVKPVIGVVSDSIPLFGYSKRYYLVILFVLGGVTLLSAAFLPSAPSSGPTAAALFFFTVLGVAGSDLMCEGKYSEIMVKKKETGSTAVTWVWLCVMTGSVIAASIEGPLADKANPRVVLFVLFPFILLPIVPTLLGWLPERRIERTFEVKGEVENNVIVGRFTTTSSGRSCPSNCLSSAAVKHKGIALLSVLTSLVAVGMLILSLSIEKQFPVLIYVGICVSLLQVLSFRVLPRAAAAANLFMFCKELSYVQINGALDYFYTASPSCLADGPHFSFTYYQTFANIAAAVGGLLGVALFQRFLSTRPFRLVFWITTALKVAAAFFDLMIVLRWNKSIGIPDKAAYICGDAIIGQVALMLDFMPVAVLIAKLCPRGMEATMYSLLAGFANFGQISSRALGGLVTEAFNIRSVEPCDFSNMWQLVVVCHMILPLAVIPLSVILIPNKSMKEDILDPSLTQGGTSPSTMSDTDEGEGSVDATALPVDKRHQAFPIDSSLDAFSSTAALDASLISEESTSVMAQ